jgi:hypothetical protein
MTTSAESGPVVDTAVSHVDSALPVPPHVRRTKRKRRPSGAAPPLPRNIGRSGRGWIVAVIVLIVWMIVTGASPRARRGTDQVDAAILRGLARLRTGWLTTAARGVDRFATGWSMFVVASSSPCSASC